MEDFKSKFAGVKSSGKVTVVDIIDRLSEAKEIQQKAFIYFLEETKKIDGVVLKAGHQGISGYCYDRNGKEREAFHFSIRTTHDDLTVYQLIGVLDPQQIFINTEPNNKSKKYGHISGENIEENEAVLKVFKMCVIKLNSN